MSSQLERVSVLVPIAVDRPYTYVNEDGPLMPGTIVRVPLGPRQVIGAVWDVPVDQAVDAKKLRSITEVFPAPPLNEELMQFVDWVANYTLSSPGMILRMVLRVPAALTPEPPIKGIRRLGPPPTRMTTARERVLSLLEESDMAWSRTGLVSAAAVSASVVDGLVTAGTCELIDLPTAPQRPRADPDFQAQLLTDQQQDAVSEIKRHTSEEDYCAILLDGVTGSGKTEVYLEAIADCLRNGKQTLILMPEIALTNEFLARIERRFGTQPGVWHSDISPKQRERLWRDSVENRVDLVIGARSALYLPFADLGLIIVDEEHDAAYKQDDRVIYNARDMAVVRAKTSRCPVILASATPSVESMVNVEASKYHHVVLPERFSAGALPSIETVDMRTRKLERGHFLSAVTLEAISKTLETGKQVMLFLNRRGYAPLTLCRSCGHRFSCDNCSAWLVEHRFRKSLDCHHCGHQQKSPEACPQCGDLDSLTACGPGIERIFEEISGHFPEKRTVILSSDLAGGAQRMKLELNDVAKGKVDIVIGTQLLAKGHNFPDLALVCVVDADIGLTNGDPRASERTYQLLSQVTGRAGRAARDGRGLIQTYHPGHPVITALVEGDREGFYAREIEARLAAGLPPYARLAAIVVSAPERDQALAYAKSLRAAAKEAAHIEIFGPAEAPLAMLRGRHRFRILLRAPRSENIQGYIKNWFASAPPMRGALRRSVDIDPQTFL